MEVAKKKSSEPLVNGVENEEAPPSPPPPPPPQVAPEVMASAAAFTQIYDRYSL